MDDPLLGILALSAYWLIFWRKFLWNPYLLCTSEMASTFFPFWRWMGRKWQATDDIYYKYPACIPFLSMFYLPHVLTAWVSRRLSEDAAFKVLADTVLAHYLLGSIICFNIYLPYGQIPALFGAITLTYSGYCIKPQQPCIAYTLAWMPGMLIGGPIGWISCFMAVTAGYWPILIYFLPVVLFVNPSALWGIAPGLLQVIPFAWYWPRSVRNGEKVDKKFGRLDWWRLFDLILPIQHRGTMNGVQFTEYQMYMGLAVLFIWKASWWWLVLLIALCVMTGLIPAIQRIPARSLYLATFALTSIALTHLQDMNMKLLILFSILQGFLLLKNSSIYPSFPFSQWWDRPSRLYTKKPKMSNWPYLTGYREGERISEYQGAFRLKSA